MYQKEVQFYEDPYHDDVGKALKAFLEAKTKKENHFAMSNLQTVERGILSDPIFVHKYR